MLRGRNVHSGHGPQPTCHHHTCRCREVAGRASVEDDRTLRSHIETAFKRHPDSFLLCVAASRINTAHMYIYIKAWNTHGHSAVGTPADKPRSALLEVFQRPRQFEKVDILPSHIGESALPHVRPGASPPTAPFPLPFPAAPPLAAARKPPPSSLPLPLVATVADTAAASLAPSHPTTSHPLPTSLRPPHQFKRPLDAPASTAAASATTTMGRCRCHCRRRRCLRRREPGWRPYWQVGG